MKRVEREELLGLAAYERIREHFRGRVIAAKAVRRLELGTHMSIVFENHDSVLLQIQEMLRTERISDERGIAHELETYNELIPARDALSASLYIEYDDPAERRRMLGRFASLRQLFKLRIGESAVAARFSTHHGEELDRLPAINYLMFQLAPGSAARLRDASLAAEIAIEHPDYPLRLALSPALREELARDLEE